LLPLVADIVAVIVVDVLVVVGLWNLSLLDVITLSRLDAGKDIRV